MDFFSADFVFIADGYLSCRYFRWKIVSSALSWCFYGYWIFNLLNSCENQTVGLLFCFWLLWSGLHYKAELPHVVYACIYWCRSRIIGCHKGKHFKNNTKHLDKNVATDLKAHLHMPLIYVFSTLRLRVAGLLMVDKNAMLGVNACRNCMW